jgi:transposase
VIPHALDGDGPVRIYVATTPVDFRKGMDGLAAVVERDLGLDPFCGALYVFRAKRGDRVKVLTWDGTGLLLAYKRLEGGGFAWPSVRDGVMSLSKAQFAALFEGLDWKRVRATPVRRPAAAQ